jgi:hypothetical protein
MAEQVIICPNCGAQNSQYGKCEYCGCDVHPSKEEINIKVKVHGIHKVEIDSRVLKQKYDKFKDKTETYYIGGDDNGWFEIPIHYLDHKGEEQVKQERINLYHIQKKWDEGYVALSGGHELGNCVFHSDGVNYDIYHEIDRQSLHKICSAKALEIGFEYKYIYDAHVDQAAVTLIQLLLRVFYCSFYDNSQFNEAIEQLYSFYNRIESEKQTKYNKNRAKEEAEATQWEAKMKEIEKNEKKKSCCIGLIVFLILTFLIIGGIIRLTYRM